MTAARTAGLVLGWAATAPAAPGPRAPGALAPTGPLSDLAEIGAPDARLVDLLRYLAAAAAARLGAGTPPFGDPAPVGLGALWLAAAIGGRHDPNAVDLVTAVPAVPLSADAGWAEATARHGVVDAYLRGGAHGSPGDGPEALPDALLEASPLTAVLYRPPVAGNASAMMATHHLLRRKRGAAILVARFAQPVRDPVVLGWHATVLAQLRQHHPNVLLDVYVTARLWHGQAWDEQITAARLELTGVGRASDAALATLRFWKPLADLVREQDQRRGLRARLTNLTGTARHDTRDRLFLRPAEYGPVVELVGRYRRFLMEVRAT